MPNTLQDMRSLVESYTAKFPVIDKYQLVSSLNEDFKSNELFDDLTEKNDKRFGIVKQIIEDYSQTALFESAVRYDLYKRLKIKLNENIISDVTADMLNPQINPFAKSIIVKLLERNEKKRISSIITSTDDNMIAVKREERGYTSRIDIRIYTKNLHKENAVVDIELKVGHGSETIKDGKFQTAREWEDLCFFSKTNGIPPENIAAFFVTNNGTMAKSKNFTAVSRYDLNTVICETIEIEQNLTGIMDRDGFGALKHFFQSRWLF